jgi:predicted heme/steroid binding protein
VTGSNELNVYFGSSNVAGLIDAGYAASGQVVNVSLGYALSPNTVLTVIDNTSSSPIGGTFSNLPNGGTLSLAYQGAVYNLTASYSGGSGHDLTLTYTGESNTSGSVNSTDSPVMSPLDLCLLAALIFGLAAKSLPRPQPVRVE